MPRQSTYRVTLDNGEVFDVEVNGTAPPTEQEIYAYLDQQNTSREIAALPAMTPMASHASAQGPVDPNAAVIARFSQPNPMTLATEENIRSGLASASDILPTVGGLAGGLIGGAGGTVLGMGVGGVPGAVGGAALGGAAGESARQLIRRGIDQKAPATMGEAASGIGTQAALQGGAELGGQVAMKAAAKGGRWLMNRALNVSDRLAREFPEMSQTAIDHAITVSQGGYKKALNLLKAAKAETATALQTAEVGGQTVAVQMTPEIAESFKTALTEQAVKSGATRNTGSVVSAATNRLDDATRALFQEVDDAATAGATVALKPTHADLLKTQLQRESKSLYAAKIGPNGMPAIGPERTIKADVAAQLNDAIDAIAQGYKESNKAAQSMIGVTRGVKRAIRPGSNLYQAMVRPGVGALLGGGAGYQRGGPQGALAGAVTGAVLTSPGTMSREALLLSNPTIQALFRQLPRATVAAIKRDLGQPEPSGESPTP